MIGRNRKKNPNQKFLIISVQVVCVEVLTASFKLISQNL